MLAAPVGLAVSTVMKTVLVEVDRIVVVGPPADPAAPVPLAGVEVA